jgi:hypothetical protein
MKNDKNNYIVHTLTLSGPLTLTMTKLKNWTLKIGPYFFRLEDTNNQKRPNNEQKRKLFDNFTFRAAYLANTCRSDSHRWILWHFQWKILTRSLYRARASAYTSDRVRID